MKTETIEYRDGDVALRGFLKHFQFKLDLGFGGEDLECSLAGLQNAVDLGKR